MKKAVKSLCIVLLSLILLALLGTGIAGYIIITPERITPILLRFGNQHLNAEIQCEAIDITFFSTFPNMGIRLRNGYVIKPASGNVAADTLLRFPSCVISFNPIDYLKKDKLVIHDIHLDRPDIYAGINKDGEANWENVWPAGDSTAAADSAAFQMPELNLEQLRITGGKIVFNNQHVALRQVIDDFDMTVAGHMNKDSAQLHLRIDIRHLSIWRHAQCLADNMPLQLTTVIQQDLVHKSIHIGQATCTLAGLAFDVNGSLQWNDTLSNALMVNLHYNLHAPAIPQLLAMVPPFISTLPSKITTAGEIILNGQVSGVLSGNSYPALRANFKLLNGRIRSTKYPHRTGIENLQLESEAYIDLTNRTPSTLRLNRFAVQSRSVNLTASAAVTDLFNNPFIKANIAGRLNFNRLARMLQLTDSMAMNGQIDMNISGECFLADVMNLNYGKIKANGTVDVDSVRINVPAQQISVTAPLLRARFGANVKDTSRRGREHDILFRGRIHADSINIMLGDLLLNSDSLSVTFGTSKPKDSTAIAPVFSNISAKNLHLRADNLHLQAIRTSGTALLIPQRNNPSTPEYLLQFTLDTLNARMHHFLGRVSSGLLQIKVKPRLLPTRRSNINADTSAVNPDRRNNPPRTGAAAAGSAIADMRLQSDRARTALRQWDVTGNFDIRNTHLRTPYFPTRMQIAEGSLIFSTDSLQLKTLQVQVGRSAMTLSGQVHGIRQALLRNGRLKADLHIDAKTINLNQLIHTMAAGSKYAALDSAAQNTVAAGVLNDAVEIAETSSADSTSGVFVIPRNIDFTLHAKIDRVLYSKLELEDINTHIFIRNQALHLPEMTFRSNVGDMRLSLSYQAADATGAHIGTTLALQRIQVKQLIETFPLFDTLTPMLRSFDGVVDCDMAATADLDALMNVQFPTTQASCLVKGKDLVLLDGETFTEIAKMLRFKNKQRNLIDSISVEMILRDNYLMIFPFHLTIDRYQAAVGGTQYLNLDFDYHITVLKSPIPFKFGLNLKGNPDHMKIRLAKALYKDIGDPVKKQLLYGVLFNLRSAMEQKIKTEIETILNHEPERRPRTSKSASDNRATPPLDDSLRVFFASDTLQAPSIDSLVIKDQ